MIRIKQKANNIQSELQFSPLGTIKINVDFIQIGNSMEYLFSVENVTGIKEQWVDTDFSLLTFEENIILKLEELYPLPEEEIVEDFNI